MAGILSIVFVLGANFTERPMSVIKFARHFHLKTGFQILAANDFYWSLLLLGFVVLLTMTSITSTANLFFPEYRKQRKDT